MPPAIIRLCMNVCVHVCSAGGSLLSTSSSALIGWKPCSIYSIGFLLGNLDQPGITKGRKACWLMKVVVVTVVAILWTAELSQWFCCCAVCPARTRVIVAATRRQQSRTSELLLLICHLLIFCCFITISKFPLNRLCFVEKVMMSGSDKVKKLKLSGMERRIMVSEDSELLRMIRWDWHCGNCGIVALVQTVH